MYIYIYIITPDQIPPAPPHLPDGIPGLRPRVYDALIQTFANFWSCLASHDYGTMDIILALGGISPDDYLLKVGSKVKANSGTAGTPASDSQRSGLEHGAHWLAARIWRPAPDH